MKIIECRISVNRFSKRAVDVAVCVHNGKRTKKPFVFVEVKTYGSDIEEGLHNLKVI